MELMALERLRKFFFPEEYERKVPEQSVKSDSMASWKTLAEFLGLDSDSDPDAMQEATYYTCLKIISEAIGRMPVQLTLTTERGGVEDANGHQLHDVLKLRPNRFMSATQFWSCMERHRLHYGNAFARIKGSGTKNDPYELWFMPNSEVEVFYDMTCAIDEIPDVYYFWSTGGRIRVLRSSEVIHVRSSDTVDGIMGIPLIDRLADTVSGGLKSQKFHNSLISSGMTGKSVLQYSGEINGESEKVFAKNIAKYINGEYADESIRDVIPIPVGTQLTPLNIKLTDAQFEELKKYNAIQIASAFGIKPQQIGDMTKTSYASSQAQNEAFYTDTLLFITKGYEEEAEYKCLSTSDRARGYHVSFDTSTTLKASFETEVKTLDIAVKGSLMTPDEARRRLKLPTVEGGDVLYANGNLIPLAMAGIQYTSGDAPPGDDGGGEEQ